MSESALPGGTQGGGGFALPPVTVPDMAVRFLGAWFGGEYPDQYMTLGSLKAGGGAGGRAIPRYVHVSPAPAAELIAREGLDDLVYESGASWNLYVSVGVADEPPRAASGKASRIRKGGKRGITRVPGVWVDLDVNKQGFFESEEECLQLLRGLADAAEEGAALPTIVVATGTGGVHAYWRTERSLSGDEAEALCTRWWAYLSSRTPHKIDKLTNADRIMKLPGSVRWAKAAGEPATLVRLLYADPERRVPVELLKRLSGPAHAAWQDDLMRRKSSIASARARADQDLMNLTAEAGESRWQRLMTAAVIEDWFNETYAWDQLLLPYGWTKLEEDGDGRTIWARPGLAEHELHKSAATDFDGSHVMSLFSDAEETGLTRLLETGISVTKYRFYVEVVYSGNEPWAVKELLDVMWK